MNWTSEYPQCAGWYFLWRKRKSPDALTPVEVVEIGSRLFAVVEGRQLGRAALDSQENQWFGPIPYPEGFVIRKGDDDVPMSGAMSY